MAMAGTFYPADAEECARQVAEFLSLRPRVDMRSAVGAIVPHAGWMCSGAVAGEALATLARVAHAEASPAEACQTSKRLRVVVVFAAIHMPFDADRAVLDEYDAWAIPGGCIAVATDLREKLHDNALFMKDDRFHRDEHAVEVELPLIAKAFPDARILPIAVPPDDQAASVGESVARLMASRDINAVYLASSDLTHYGPAYRFTPAGVSERGFDWAKENDRRLLSLVTAMRVEAIVPEVRRWQNACGGGAIAAMLSACRFGGATEAEVLRHVNSREILSSVSRSESENAVGYAGVIVR